MLDHHLQRDIVYSLAFSDGLRFSELKPDDIENKLFTYHLKKVLSAGFVEKSDEGLYRLTPEGRRVGVGAFRDHHMAIDRAYSILILIVRRATDGAWLLYRRKTHPLRDLQGFMHTTPHASADATTRAKDECLRKTGLEADFTVCGEGYFRVYDGDELESFTHFTLLVAEDVTDELEQRDEFAEYEWSKEPDFDSDTMLPNTAILKSLYEDSSRHFIEETFRR